MLNLPNPSNLRRLTIGITRRDGERATHHLSSNGAGALVEQAPAAPPPPADNAEHSLDPESNPPALILEPVRIMDFVALLVAAHAASRALDRFVQLRDPSGIDLRALERLQTALEPFYPAPNGHKA